MTPWGRCRRCGMVTYRRGPCPTCRVYGEYGAVDRIEVVAPGTVAELRKGGMSVAQIRKETGLSDGVVRWIVSKVEE